MNIRRKEVMPDLLRELQQKKNHGQGSQCEFSLYCGEVANNTVDFRGTASRFMVKNGSVLAVRKSKPVQTGSLKGAGSQANLPGLH